MHILNLAPILFVTFLATVTLAADPHPWIAQRATDSNIGGHYACHDANFTGSCKYYLEPRGQCHTYAKKNWGKYTSIAPNLGQFCWFYEWEQCLGKKVELEWPGTRNLRGLRFDNRVKSWNCWEREWWG